MVVGLVVSSVLADMLCIGMVLQVCVSVLCPVVVGAHLLGWCPVGPVSWARFALAPPCVEALGVACLARSVCMIVWHALPWLIGVVATVSLLCSYACGGMSAFPISLCVTHFCL